MDETLERKINDLLKDVRDSLNDFNGLIISKKKEIEDLLEQERGAFDESSNQVQSKVSQLSDELSFFKESLEALSKDLNQKANDADTSINAMEERIKSIEEKSRQIEEANEKSAKMFEKLIDEENKLANSFEANRKAQEAVSAFNEKSKVIDASINSASVAVEQIKEEIGAIRQRLIVALEEAKDHNRSIDALFQEQLSKRNELQADFEKRSREQASKAEAMEKKIEEISNAINNVASSEMYRVITSMTLEQYLQAVADGAAKIILQQIRDAIINDVVECVETEKSGVFGHKLRLIKKESK